MDAPHSSKWWQKKSWRCKHDTSWDWDLGTKEYLETALEIEMLTGRLEKTSHATEVQKANLLKPHHFHLDHCKGTRSVTWNAPTRETLAEGRVAFTLSTQLGYGEGWDRSQDYENGQPARASTAFRLEQNKQLNLTKSASYRFKENGFDKCIFRLKLFMAPPWIFLMLVASLLFQRQQMDRNSSALSILPVNTVYGVSSQSKKT